jgi:PAS domain S-box-containing protein
MTSLTAPDFQLLFESVPGLYLVLLPDFTVAAVSNAYLTATNCKKEALVGHNIFKVFPDNPVDFAHDEASCMTNLRASLNYVITHCKPQKMAVQKYSLPGTDGKTEDRYWNPHNKPVFNDQQELVFIIHEVEDVTNHIRSEKKFFDFLDAAKEATIIMNKLGAIKIANKYACKLFGYSKDELVNQQVEILIPDELKEMHRNQRKQFNVSSGMREMNSGDTFIAVKKNGIRFPVEINLSPVNTDEGILVCATIKDISDQKTQQEKLALLSKQINQANDAIFTVDANRNITSWNKGAEKLYGYSSEEALGKESMSFLQTDISQDEMDLLTYTIATHDHFATKLKRKTKAGNDIYIQASISTIKNNNGEITGYVAVNIDITEQKKLREQVNYLARLVEQSSDAIISRATDKSMASWNSGAEKLFGFSSEEAIGKTAKELGISRLTPEELEEIDQAFFEKGTWKAEKLYYRKNGTSFWGSVTGNIVRNDAGKLVSEVFIIKDINTEKELVAALQKSNEKLEAKVKERTSEIEKSEKKYRYLFENNPLPMWITDMDSLKFLTVNKMAILNYGYSREEFLQMTAVDIRPDEEKALFVQYVRSDETNETNYHNGVWQHLKKDGSIILVEIIVHHINFEGIPARLVLANNITEKKKAEEKLVASEKRFRALIENNYDMISLMDTSFKIIYRSHSTERITGWTLEEMHAGPGTPYIHPDDLEQTVSIILDIMKNPGKASYCSFRYLHKNGNYFWVEGVIRNLLEEDDIHAVVFNFRDINKQKMAEEKTIASEEHFRHTLDNMLEGVQILDFDLRYLYVNDAMAKHGRYPKEQFAGKSVYEMYPGIETMQVFEAYQTCLTKRIPVHLENEFTFPDGSTGWFELSFQPVPEGLFILSVDITERKKSEIQLNDQRAQLKTLGDNLTGVMIYQLVGDADGNRQFTYVSDGVKRLTGKTPEEVMADPSILYYMLVEEDREKFRLAELDAGKKMSIFNIEVRCRSHLNEIRWLNIVSTPRVQQNGQVVWDGFHIDITERKEVEEKIAIRTEQLKKSNQELEAFSYSVSHDLRAPLRGIIGFTSILEDEYSNKLDDEAKRITGIIKSNTLKMGSLIDDLLAFSRIGQQEIDKISFDSTELVKQTIAGIDNKNGTIEWVIQPLHKAYGDYTTIRQVWINLISNAVKYSSGKEKQCIETGSYEEPDQVVFFVKDNGVGFDKKYADKLFKVFQRLHSTTEFEGTGIGLAIVEKIISKHGGRVWADAEKGEGACFYFSLPKQHIQSI